MNQQRQNEGKRSKVDQVMKTKNCQTRVEIGSSGRTDKKKYGNNEGKMIKLNEEERKNRVESIETWMKMTKTRQQEQSEEKSTEQKSQILPNHANVS